MRGVLIIKNALLTTSIVSFFTWLRTWDAVGTYLLYHKDT